MQAVVGDTLVVKSRHVGEHERECLIVEVRGNSGEPPYLVRWSTDGHEGLFFPGPDVVITHVPQQRG